jgi:hypothetical protein
MIRTLRNIGIIALLALVVAAVPGGGNAATAVVTALTICFLGVIAFAGYRIYLSQKLTILSLDDRQRLVLIGAVGLIVLMIAGADELLETGLGTLAWIGLLAAAAVAIWRLWVQSQTY